MGETRNKEKPEALPVDDDSSLEKKGIWEVRFESGAVIGYYEGTPGKIAQFIVATDDEGRYIRKLIFMLIPVKKIPERLMKNVCCDKHFSKTDNFCSRCGKNLTLNGKLPSKLKIIVEA